METTLKIARLFLTDAPVISVRPLGEGLINDTFLVVSERGTGYVLQRINNTVFRDVNVLQDNLRLITNHIRSVLVDRGEKDVERKVLSMIPALDGSGYVEVDGEFWRMTLFITGSHTHTHVTAEMAEMTGRAFAEFHSYFAMPGAPELQETIPDFHNIGFRIAQLRSAVEKDTVRRLHECRSEVQILLARSEEMTLAQRMYDAGELPRRVAHYDTKLDNILFDEDGNILCVIDLDTTMPGFVLSDFGDFVRTACNTGQEDDRNLDNVSVDMEIFSSFARGYVKYATFLTVQERRLLPFGAKMLTYMQAVRFLTDYLNGDTYYKTVSADHNLIRTRAQMKLLDSIDDNFSCMERIIDSI